jgi:hypothetical protein
LDCTAPKGLELIVPPEEFLGKTVYEVLPPNLAQQIMDHLLSALETGEVQTFESQFSHNGQQRDYEARLVVSRKDEEVLAIVRDVTERKLLEAQFFQSQKMESLGRRGVSPTISTTSWAASWAMPRSSRPDWPLRLTTHEFAPIIETATRRGAHLTQQLLTAARKSPLQTSPMDVNEAVQEVVQILSRTLPKNITITNRLQPQLP